MLQRMGSFAGMSMGGDVLAAIPRYYSPEEYFVQSQIPYKIQDDRQRIELYKWLDLFYRTHTLIPILVDIFTRFPLVGMELDCEDDQLTEFYEQVFFDDLDYEQFLVDLGREYWTLGESWPLGHFSESLGVWEEEELLDPALIEVKKFPIIGTQQFYLLPPPDLAEIAKRRQPEPLYHLLVKEHEDLIPFLLSGKPIPVSEVLLKQVAFKASRRDLHGTPLLLRCLRQLIHEEKLMASQDAIAERLYSPLLLVKLGVQDMGPNRGPWIPGPDAVASLRNDLDIALASDMRLMVHHFGIEVQNVWGREQMPRLDMDFDRIERKLMQTFGVNPNLLAGGASAQPYASSALQAEFLNQILRTYQKYLKRHYESRAAIVAEAQEHYAYEKRGPQPLDAKVLTPHGWTTMGELNVGDQVIGRDGCPTNVTEIIDQGEQDVYRITFSDNSSTECAGNHNWYIWKHSKRRTNKPCILTVEEMLREGISYSNGINKYWIPHVDPIKFQEIDLPIDPYLLGLILGDGCLGISNGAITLATHQNDLQETYDLIEDLIPIGVTSKFSGETTSPRIRIARNKGLYRNPLASSLKEVGLWQVRGENKFVPGIYLRSSIEQRLSLLQGLMDSDGSSRLRPGGGIVSDFATSSIQLAQAVMDLVGSLGGSATLAVKKQRSNCLPEFVVTIKRLPNNIIPHRLQRKIDVWSRGNKSRSGRYRYIKSIDLIGKKYVRCITVDNNEHLYVTDDYIVTHNSTRIPIMEEVIRYDDEGNEYIEERKKLMYPELKMKVLDLRDEATQRQFLQVLKQAGVPVPDTDLAMGMGYDFSESLAKMEEELIQKTVAQQDAKVKTYDILSARGLPIPPDLQAEIEGQGQAGAAAPGAGAGDTMDMGGDIPSGGDTIPMPPPPGGMGGPGMPPAISPYGPQRGMFPEQSFERSPLTGPGAMMSPNTPGMGIAPAGLIAPTAPGRMSKVSSDGSKIYGERHGLGGGMPKRYSHTVADVLDAQADLLEKYNSALTPEEVSAIMRENDNAENSRG